MMVKKNTLRDIVCFIFMKRPFLHKHKSFFVFKIWTAAVYIFFMCKLSSKNGSVISHHHLYHRHYQSCRHNGTSDLSSFWTGWKESTRKGVKQNTRHRSKIKINIFLWNILYCYEDVASFLCYVTSQMCLFFLQVDCHSI